MSEIAHTPEFSPKVRAGEDSVGTSARDLAKAYARTFSSEDGRRVLRDLRAKFGVERLCFHFGSGSVQPAMHPAWIDGQRSVMKEIEEAMRAGSTGVVVDEGRSEGERRSESEGRSERPPAISSRASGTAG